MINFNLGIRNSWSKKDHFKNIWDTFKKVSENWGMELQIYRDWNQWFELSISIRDGYDHHRGINAVIGCLYFINFDFYDKRHEYDVEEDDVE